MDYNKSKIESNKRIAKNSVILSIRMIVVLAVSLYTTRAVLNILGVVDYGVFNVVCGFVSMFAFLNTSMSNGIQRFFNYELGKNGEKGARKVYCTALIIQILLALIVIVLTESVGLWYLYNKMVIPEDRFYAANWIFHFSVISFIFTIMQAPYTAAVISHERMDFFAFASVLDVLLKLAIVVMLPYIVYDHLIIYGSFFAIVSIINILLYYIYCKINFPEISLTGAKSLLDKGFFRSMLSFSGWNLFGSLSGVMQTQGINLVVNFFFGPVVNAARGVAAQVNAGLQGLVGNITMPVRPQVVQSYAKGDLNRTMNLTYSVSKFSCCFLLMMSIPITIEMKYVLNFWLGDNVPDHAASFTIIVLFNSLLSNLNSATSGVVHATGIMRDYQLCCSVVKILSVPISFFVLTMYSIPELALLIVFLCGIIGHTAGLFVLKKLVGLSVVDYGKRIVMPIFVVIMLSFGILLPIHFFMQESFMRLVVIAIFGVIVIGGLTYIVVLDSNEKNLLLRMVGTIKNRIEKSKKLNYE